MGMVLLVFIMERFFRVVLIGGSLSMAFLCLVIVVIMWVIFKDFKRRV
jgi:hypothetical protein